jgi:hypothetical protein
LLWSDKNWLSLAMYASMATTDTEGINILQGHKFEDIDYATWQFRLRVKVRRCTVQNNHTDGSVSLGRTSFEVLHKYLAGRKALRNNLSFLSTGVK